MLIAHFYSRTCKIHRLALILGVFWLLSLASTVAAKSLALQKIKTNYPIVFVHGFAGFGKMALVGNYFRGLNAATAGPLNQIYTPELPPFAPSDIRAPILAAEIQRILKETGADKVHLFAHSLGGLDARKAIADFHLEDKVFSLTTFATPHRGTLVASTFKDFPSWLLETVFVPMNFTYDILRGRNVGPMDIQQTLLQMSPENMVQFNQDYPPPQKVHLFSIAGVTSHPTSICDGPWGKMSFEDSPIPIILPTYLWLRGAPTNAQPNDGVVSVESARWEGFLGCVPADHFDQVGKGADFVGAPNTLVLDHLDFYLQYMKRLHQLAATGDEEIMKVPMALVGQ